MTSRFDQVMERMDRVLEAIESRLVRGLKDNRENLRRIGPCHHCGEWVEGTISGGFVHKDDGLRSCADRDETAIPRQVYKEEILNDIKKHWKD